MRTLSRVKAGSMVLLLSIYVILNSFAEDTIPLVYDVEFTGEGCAMPSLPVMDSLPVVEPLTDPFEWSDGSGRDTSFESWVCRRAEIKAEIENYEIGPKPDRPDTIDASYENDTLTVSITVNGNTLTLTSAIKLPEGEGPFPAVIGIASGTGSLPSDIFSSRNIAQIPFYFWEVMAHTQVRGSEPINKLYPDLIYMGAYCAWSWGVSRLIDGLELVSEDLPIDLEHLAVTGCSYAGKMALFAGAFDERIALTLVQESGGGGAAAWRVSETLPAVEKLGATSSAWFIEDMFQFAGSNVSKLPHDHHELMAMVAPRAMFVLGNPDYEWLAEESGYVSCAAAKKVWENFGIPDRFGFCIVGGHVHCALASIQRTGVEAFVDKFLLDDTTANTDISDHIYDYVIPEYWTDWWGKGAPQFPVLDRGDSEEVWLEAECATVGAGWNVRLDTLASNDSYIVPKTNLIINSETLADSASLVYFPFAVDTDATFYLYAHVNDTVLNNSYWLKLDNGSFNKVYCRLDSLEWQWIKLTSFDLTAGEHTLVFAKRGEGIKLDKICISEFYYLPGELGEPAEFLCEPDTTTKFYSGIDEVHSAGTYTLGQNYPNPFNNNTIIAFEIHHSTYISLKVYSILGEEIAELAGKEYPVGKHTVEFNAQNLAEGVYFYTLKGDKFLASRRMIIQTE